MSGSLLSDDERNLLLERAFDSTSTKTVISQYQWGTGTTEPSVSDTDLESGIDIKRDFLSTTHDTDDHELELNGFLPSTSGNGNDVSELGTFNTDGTPLLGLHAVWDPTGINKDNTFELHVEARNKMRNRL